MQSLNDILSGQLVPRFAGEIWESDATVPMGMGYAKDVQGKPFDIESAQYLKPVFRAIRNPTKRKIVLRGAVQTLKTFVVEKSAIYFARHDPGDMTFYDCDLEAAIDHAKTRIGPLLKSIPGLAAQFEEVLKSNRFDITTTEFILPGMTLRLWPLNLSSTQRMTLRYVCISDAFLSKNTGLLEQAIARTTQHLLDKKVIIESQGSDEDDDFDRQFNDTDQASLWVNCPLCAAAQEFVWEARRDDGTFAGMRRGPDELVKLPEGGYDAQAVLEHTHYECLHCRGRWDDTPTIREALDHSSHYIAANPTANPENAGFMWPRWINRRLGWGETMLKYLVAKRAETEFGNKDPIKQWWQKCGARTWNDRMTLGTITPIIGTAKFDGMIPNEAIRSGQVDCQKAVAESQRLGREVTGHFWAVADAIDKAGNRFELWRGYCTSWEEWIAKFKALKIPTRNIAIDGGHWFDDVKEQAARHRTIEDGTDRAGNPCKVWATWKVLRGSDLRGFRWPDGQWRAYRVTTDIVSLLDEKTGKWNSVNVPVVEWSNLTVKNQLHLSLLGMPGKPKMTGCPPSQLSITTRAKEAEKDFSYESQLNSEILGEYRGKPKWLSVHKQCHYRDCKCEGIVLAMMKGLVGAIAPPDESAQMVEG